MDWIEKAERLLKTKTAAKVERAAGWKPNRLRTSINERRKPNAVDGVKLAHAFGVTSDWLFDDSLDWPPPSSVDLVEASPEQLQALAWVELQIRSRKQREGGPPGPSRGKKRRGRE